MTVDRSYGVRLGGTGVRGPEIGIQIECAREQRLRLVQITSGMSAPSSLDIAVGLVDADLVEAISAGKEAGLVCRASNDSESPVKLDAAAVRREEAIRNLVLDTPSGATARSE